MALSVYGEPPLSVFRLNGKADENSASFALGWTLEKSPGLLGLLTEAIFGQSLDTSNTVITLQKHVAGGGFTDIELQATTQFHAIIEAKRWWDVPSVDQLRRYLPRLITGAAKHLRLVSVSAAKKSQAQRDLPASLDGVGTVHLSWGDIQRLAGTVQAKTRSFEEKLWLRQLIVHLQEFISVKRLSDDNVFVVSLGSGPLMSTGTHTWIDVVETERRYFHPVGNRWPIEPPNYIGFRYHGRLQSVHHVDGFEVVNNLADYNKLWPPTDYDHFVYHLGNAMRPPREMRTGPKIPRAAWSWCAIDTLLSGTYDTIGDARDATNQRLAAEL
jgi:hypothetical protein